MQAYEFSAGSVPVIISMPHCGTEIPPEIQSTMTSVAGRLADTDWHLSRLYDFANGLGCSVLHSVFSRYVIDLNRSPDNQSLYPGANVTELCPTSTFAEEPLYAQEHLPDSTEIQKRVESYWQPYHQKLESEVKRLRDQFGVVIVFEAHSIASVVPRFFEGQLPDFNLGTNRGATCDVHLEQCIAELLSANNKYSHVINGRFKGGYLTRHFGRPQENVHAMQLELSQATYMQEQWPFEYRTELAQEVQPVLESLVQSLIDWGLKRANESEKISRN